MIGLAPEDCGNALKDRWQQAAECKDLYKLAQDCLAEDENERPSFEQIIGKRESQLFTKSCKWTVPLGRLARRVRVLAVGGGACGYGASGGCAGCVKVGEYL